MNIVCHPPKRLHLGVSVPWYINMKIFFKIFFDGIKLLHRTGFPYFWFQFLYFRCYGLV